MNTATRVGAFGAGLAIVFAAALGTGRLVGPFDTATAPAAHADMAGDHGTDDHGSEHGSSTTAVTPVGLSATDRGYRLVPDATTVAPTTNARVTFRILGPDGQPVTHFTTAHEKQLHLIVVRRDLSGFQHVHPTMAADGTWSVTVDLSRPGQWRLLADFDPAGVTPGLVLGTDLAVPGRYAPVALPEPAPTTSVGDFTLRTVGNLSPGRSQPVAFTIARTAGGTLALEPYLGACGHLVVLREGDLAYAHAHASTDPTPVAGGAAALGFQVEAPGPGRYRMFLDFKVAGAVHTAAFTLDAAGATP
ncbi:hypothetical protein [Phycicoccus sp. Root101]|uniref:hypothetical protein n=1 Tax=Phycicoccus sp. Root101 TaxID=1736421 RepID=UPI0007023D6D|nr:hypothetical protein [Phycicoccus sp. Root101]KQU68118.1 hypothetical protein ASC58_11100 [Phycicoccus sp. Root101]